MKTISKDVVISGKQCWIPDSTHTDTHPAFMYIHYPWTLNSHPSLGNIVWAVSFLELSYWKCICSTCVSKESAYLMLTSWDLARKQTWSPLCRLKITTTSHGWVKEETERKEKKEMWREGMRLSQCTVKKVRLLLMSESVSWGRFEA